MKYTYLALAIADSTSADFHIEKDVVTIKHADVTLHMSEPNADYVPAAIVYRGVTCNLPITNADSVDSIVAYEQRARPISFLLCHPYLMPFVSHVGDDGRIATTSPLEMLVYACVMTDGGLDGIAKLASVDQESISRFNTLVSSYFTVASRPLDLPVFKLPKPTMSLMPRLDEEGHEFWDDDEDDRWEEENNVLPKKTIGSSHAAKSHVGTPRWEIEHFNKLTHNAFTLPDSIGEVDLRMKSRYEQNLGKMDNVTSMLSPATQACLYRELKLSRTLIGKGVLPTLTAILNAYHYTQIDTDLVDVVKEPSKFIMPLFYLDKKPKVIVRMGNQRGRHVQVSVSSLVKNWKNDKDFVAYRLVANDDATTTITVTSELGGIRQQRTVTLTAEDSKVEKIHEHLGRTIRELLPVPARKQMIITPYYKSVVTLPRAKAYHE